MKIAAITKFKHGELFQLLAQLGWTQKEFSVRSKIPYYSMNKILNLTLRPTEQQISKMEIAFGNVGKVVDVASFFPDAYIGFKRPLTCVQVQDVEPAQLEYFRQYQTRMLQDAEPPLPSDVLDTEDKLQQIAQMLAGTKGELTERERDVIHRVIFKEQTCRDISADYKLSAQAVNNALHSGLRKIRDYFEGRDAPPLVDPAVIAAHSRPMTKEEEVARWEEIEERRRNYNYGWL